MVSGVRNAAVSCVVRAPSRAPGKGGRFSVVISSQDEKATGHNSEIGNGWATADLGSYQPEWGEVQRVLLDAL